MDTPESTPDPFALDPGEHLFPDATLIQCVASPSMLQWEPGGGGFFAETDAPPSEGFVQATFTTQGGKRIPGFAARTFLAFPVAYRTSWEMGEPGNRVRIPGYQDGARSHTQALVVLPSGAWAVVTGRGLASQKLAGALRSHRYWAARELEAKPFIAAISGVAGPTEKVGASHVTRFEFVTQEDERCPEELGRAIRGRWPDILAWSNGSQDTPAANPTMEAPEAVRESVGENPPAVPQDADHPTGNPVSPAEPTSARPRLHYQDGSALSRNPTEQRAFAAYLADHSQPPASRAALRTWWQEQKGGENDESA